MEHKAQLPIKVHQCLFGYEDGHRLLESSLKLPNDVESMLLRLSDLAPGFSDFNIDSYWTGVPLPSAKYYALLRTWSAPEMSRPGCVWTHVLLIGFSDIARFIDMGTLKNYSVRPTHKSQFSEYSEPILVDATKAANVDTISDSQLSSGRLLKVIRAIYTFDGQPYLFSDTNEFNTSIFRVWSQQWPGLRRSFSFRTAGSLSEKSTAGVNFHLRVLPRRDNYNSKNEQLLLSHPESWETETIDDALSAKPTGFRRFLWRYGSDIHKGFERFSFLADLFVTAYKGMLDIKCNESMLLQVAETLPEPEDGMVLKNDMIMAESNTYSLIPALDPIDCLTFFIRHPLVNGLSLSPDTMFSYIKSVWPDRSAEIFTLAELAIKKKFKLKQYFLKQLTELIEINSFFTSTNEFPDLRYKLISQKPMLLNSDGLINVSQPELFELLLLLPSDQILADQVICRLMPLDDPHIAKEMYSRFPGIVTQRVLEAIDLIPSKLDRDNQRVWLQVISQGAHDFLLGGFLGNLQSMNLLAVYAETIGYRNRDVINIGPIPWVNALNTAKDDICESKRDIFYVFLLMLAIEDPRPGCEPIFERTFDQVHSALAGNKSSFDIQTIIIESLPNLNLWKQWDVCLRLRLAVVNAYVKTKLNEDSFDRITKNQELADSLVELASEFKMGRSFIKKKRASLKKDE